MRLSRNVGAADRWDGDAETPHLASPSQGEEPEALPMRYL